MTDSWNWDETLYLGSAAYYAQGRLPYADTLPEATRDALGLQGTDRLIDVGCGPGTVTVLLAQVFGEAVGIDADGGMIEEARRNAERLGRTNTTFLKLRAEDLPAGLGTFRAATFAQSFHWTKREQVAATIYQMLDPHGYFVQIGDVRDDLPDLPDTGVPAPPQDELKELVRRWLGPVRRAGQSSLWNGTPSGESEILAAAGFQGPRRVLVPGGRLLDRTTEDLIAATYSRSDSAPHLFGEQLPEFDAEMRAILAKASPSGHFAQMQPHSELIIWQKPE